MEEHQQKFKSIMKQILLPSCCNVQYIPNSNNETYNHNAHFFYRVHLPRIKAVIKLFKAPGDSIFAA